MSVIGPSFKASLEVQISGIPVVTPGRSWNHDLQGAEYRDWEGSGGIGSKNLTSASLEVMVRGATAI